MNTPDLQPLRIRPGSLRTSEPTGEDALRREVRMKELTAGEPISVRIVLSSEPERQESRGWRRAVQAFLRFVRRDGGK